MNASADATGSFRRDALLRVHGLAAEGCASARYLFSAKSALSYQPGVSPQDSHRIVNKR